MSAELAAALKAICRLLGGAEGMRIKPNGIRSMP